MSEPSGSGERRERGRRGQDGGEQVAERCQAVRDGADRERVRGEGRVVQLVPVDRGGDRRTRRRARTVRRDQGLVDRVLRVDRKSTRLNSSHGYISYAVFCLKKKK